MKQATFVNKGTVACKGFRQAKKWHSGAAEAHLCALENNGSLTVPGSEDLSAERKISGMAHSSITSRPSIMPSLTRTDTSMGRQHTSQSTVNSALPSLASRARSNDSPQCGQIKGNESCITRTETPAGHKATLREATGMSGFLPIDFPAPFRAGS
jgi:hypothetical protein